MRFLLIVLASVVAACATLDEGPPADVVAIEDYIEVGELPEVDKLRTDSSAHLVLLGNTRYIFWKARRNTYLVEFTRDCSELYDLRRVPADLRRDSNYLRARRDTIRGCRIGRAFELNDAQVDEIRDIGEAPTGG